MRPLVFVLVAAALPAQVADKFVPAEPEGMRLFGSLGDRLKANLQQLMKADEAALLAPFEQRPWADPRAGEAVGRYLFASAGMYRYQKDQKLRVAMERVVRRLLAAQEPDGYLGTEGKAARWKSWDVSVHKEVINGLMAYARVMSDERALAAARRGGELLAATFGPAKRDIWASSGAGGWAGTALLQTICELHRATGDARLAEFAGYLVAAWDQPQGPRVLDTLLTGSVKAWPAEFAPEIVENLLGLLELYRSTGDERFLLAVTSAHEDMVGEKRFAESPRWPELNWHLLRLTGGPAYARVLAALVPGALTDPRLVALMPQLVAGAFAGGVAFVVWPEGTLTLAAAGKPVRLEIAGRQVKWVEGAGAYPLWWLGRPGRPVYAWRNWAIGGTYEVP